MIAQSQSTFLLLTLLSSYFRLVYGKRTPISLLLSHASSNIEEALMATPSILDTFDIETLANIVRSENVQRIETRFDGLIHGTIVDPADRRKGAGSSSSTARANKRKRLDGDEGNASDTGSDSGGGGSGVTVDPAHLLDLAVEPAERPPAIDEIIHPESSAVHPRIVKDLLAFAKRPPFYSPDGLSYDQIHRLASAAWAAEGVYEAEGKTARARNREEAVWRGDVEAAFCERAREVLVKRASRR
jgi:hypothetical protein